VAARELTRAPEALPFERIQNLLGHATGAMAMRYRKHAPESYFAEDAAKVVTSLTASKSKEDSGRAELAREALRLG